MLILSHLILIGVIIASDCNKDEKSVVIRMNSKWNKVPFVIEISEYFAEYTYEKYWEFLDLINSYNFTQIIPCSKQEYEIGLEMANKILNMRDDLLKFSLSMSEMIPKIQFYNSIAKDKKIPFNCEHAFSIGKETTCDWNYVENKIGSNDIISTDIDSWDRIYNSTRPNPHAKLIHYYQDLMSPEFPIYHEKLLKLAIEGKIRYIFHSIVKKPCNQLTRLSGYGAVLNIKNTDYKVIDDQKIKIPLDISQEINEYINKTSITKIITDRSDSSRNSVSINMTHPSEELLQNLGFSSIEYISHGDPGARLDRLVDISQNFPIAVNNIVIKEMSRSDITRYNQFRQAMSWNNLEDASNIYINGIGIDYDDSPFQLMSKLNKEYTILSHLKQLGFTNSESLNLLINGSLTEKYSPKLDVRSPQIIWLNSLEKDHPYWSKRIEDFFVPLWPGQFHEVGLNVFNLVLFVDSSSPYFLSHINTFQRLIRNEMPIHLGVVILTPMQDPIPRAISRAFYQLIKQSKNKHALAFIDKLFQYSNPLTIDAISNIYKTLVSGSDALFLGLDTHASDEFLTDSNSFYENTGLRDSPCAIFNGKILSADKVTENFIYNVLEYYKSDLQELRSQYQTGILDDVTNYEQYFMGGKDFLKKIKYDIVSPPPPILSLYSISATNVEMIDHQHLERLTSSELNYVLYRQGLFINADAGTRTIWLTVNLETESGFNLLIEALSSNISDTRLGILFNNLPVIPTVTISDVILDILLNSNTDNSSTALIKNQLFEYKENQSSLHKYSFKSDFLKQRDIFYSHHLFCKRSFKLSDNNSYLFYNGRQYGPMTENVITREDINLIIIYDEITFGSFLKSKMKILIGKNKHFTNIKLRRSDLLDSVKSVLSLFDQPKRDNIPILPGHLNDYCIKLEPRNDSPFIIIVAVLDPLSVVSQKWSSLLSTIHSAINCQITILLKPSFDYKALPLKRFYRYALEPSLRFDGDKLDYRSSTVEFTSLPQDMIYTFSADTLQSWFIEAVYCNCDMDNIYLKTITDNKCIGIYDLEYIMLEGHAFDIEKNSAAANLQLTMGPISNPTMFDTIVIYNLGYFQFKAFPGAFVLGLKNSETANFTIYQILSDNAPIHGVLSLDSYLGKIIRVKVKSRSDLGLEVIADETQKTQNTWWSSVSNLLFTKPVEKTESQTINIFSLATGLLYERFMRIMMLSVLKHTKTPVKFWFLKNYVSPQFIKSMEILSHKYNFEYEFVQYQWPHWLIKQTEKQRIIWGYKILFLDVLFPLDVKRIIFVDADQIVRADLNELYTMNLENAPYAYTPFCDDRPEMESFRFWKTGYWRSHLGRKPYHISALYLVDLEKFREMAAGDRLRGQYQALSNDPNSLANLDQDLPNNLQHVVPIKSLPQEWLWCETWCSDASKAKAKTIDMCNNPLTREAKLDRAKRIAPEFIEYDNTIKELLNDQYAKDILNAPSVDKKSDL